MSDWTILVGADSSDEALAAIEWTARLAADLGARVHVLHAFEPLRHLDEKSEGEDLRALQARVQGDLEGPWVAPLREAGVRLEIELAEGTPAERVLASADRIDADLIVLGQRRMGAVKAMVLGSTSKHVLDHAQRPVTIIHSPEA